MNTSKSIINVSDIQSGLSRRLADTEANVEFALLENNPDRVDFVHELLARHDLLPRFVKDGKSDQTSSDFRHQGNQMFKMKKDLEALKLYAKSIAYAEVSGENLGLAYANRAAALYELKLYRLCLIDIDRAVHNNYPERLRSKLETRKCKAAALVKTQRHLPYHQPIPEILQNCKNPLIECASNSVTVDNDPHLGRHIRATRDIEIGEIIAVEKPAYCVLLEHQWYHCYECLTLCYNLIPCDGCTQALFCSTECKTTACLSYHRVECPILLTVHELKLDKLKILPLKIALKTRDQYDEIREYKLKPDEIYKSGRYKEIHYLISNTEKRSVSDLFARTITASVIYDLVKKYTDFFSPEDEVYVEEMFKDLVLFHLQTSASNFHEITELGENRVGIYEPDELGAGAYSFASLFNHSCSPNISRFDYGTTIVLRTIETVGKGEQLFDQYGYLFAMTPKNCRQIRLKEQYFFDCNCVACLEDWPTYQKLPSIATNMDLLFSNLPQLSNACVRTARKIERPVAAKVKQLEQFQPCKNFGEMQETLRQCYSIYGNVRRTL